MTYQEFFFILKGPLIKDGEWGRGMSFKKTGGVGWEGGENSLVEGEEGGGLIDGEGA